MKYVHIYIHTHKLTILLIRCEGIFSSFIDILLSAILPADILGTGASLIPCFLDELEWSWSLVF